MKRRLFTLLSALSLLLLVCGGIGWISSYRTWRYVSPNWPQGMEIKPSPGSLAMQYLWLDGPLLAPGERPGHGVGYGCGASFTLKLGVADYRGEPVAGARVFDVSNGKPVDRAVARSGSRHWLLVRFPWFIVATCVLPGWWLVTWRCRLRQAYRRTHGLCPTCAYDLRASKERCPECGTPVPSKEMEK